MPWRTAFASVLVLLTSFSVLPSGPLGRTASTPRAEADATSVVVIGCEYVALAVDGDLTDAVNDGDVQAACGGDTPGGVLGFGSALPPVGARSIQSLANAIGNEDGTLTASDFQGEADEDWDQNQMRADCSNDALNNTQRGATYLQLIGGNACTLDVFVFVSAEAFVQLDLPSGLASIENGASDFICAYDVGSGPASTFVDGTAVTAASNTTPIVITVADAIIGLGGGDVVTVSGVGGNTAANGQRAIAVLDAMHFELVGSVGNGAYSGGGTITSDTFGPLDRRVDNDCAGDGDPTRGYGGNGDGVVLFHLINDNATAGQQKSVNVVQSAVSQTFPVNVVGPPTSVSTTLVETLIETGATTANVDDCIDNTSVANAAPPPTSTLAQATVKDAGNRVLSRVPVFFTVTPPASTNIAALGLGNADELITGNTFFTRLDALGTQPVASSRVVCGGKLTGVATIDAAINVLATPSHSTALITVGGTPSTISVGAQPTEVLCDGAQTATITATLLDGNGAPVADGIPVNFSVTSLGVVSTINALTAGGVATTVFHGLSSYTVGVPIIVTAGNSRIAAPVQTSFLMRCNGFDVDGDGLPNVFEAANICLNSHVSDSQDDPDIDGLSSLVEYNLGASPCVADSDGDGYTDGQEVALPSDPLVYCNVMRADVDGDGAVSILDITQVAAHFTQSIPPAPARYNQDSDAAISILDLTRMANVFTQPVTACL